MNPRTTLVLAGLLAGLLPPSTRAGWVWVEGEKPAKAAVSRHPWWYDKVKRDLLSGGDLISHWDDKKAGEVRYRFKAPAAGDHDFWVRVNPVQAKLSYRLNDGDWTPIDLEGEQLGSTNVAEDGKPDLRFLAWVRAGRVALKKGENAVAFRMESANNHHGYLDCFVLTDEPFQPQGTLKPDRLAEVARRQARDHEGWFAFNPPDDPFRASPIDLRDLNEARAGDGGFIGVKDGRFVHAKTGRPVRFWAVNGPPGKDRAELGRQARLLAKRGVNLVRIHHGYFDEEGRVKPDEIRHAIEVVEAMKAEGIYSHFSIYFPLWLKPKPDTPWLKGYDGNTPPFAALFFNKDFQEVYRSWWKALLTAPSPATGRRLVDEPAVFGAEILNEDSYFFWTFNDKIPDPQLRIVEAQFAAWLKSRYGSLDAAFRAWGGPKVDRDAPAEGRVGFRPLWNLANERTRRDRDTARFLAESQRTFYEATYRFLRDLGFRGLITASNWVTASPEVLGPLERYTYTVGDFIDRHGYFGCLRKGPDAGWAIKEDQTYADRSALRFDPEEPGRPRSFNHPAMDIAYDARPSMISETTWERPNRFRSEAPLFYAAFGALQDSDAIVHFAFDGARWTVKPNFFMQPWTLMTPAMMGQFPAAALIYRAGLVAAGDRLVDLDLKVGDLLDLKGTPMPQDANFDELRLKDVQKGAEVRPGRVIDPLVHFAGRTDVTFTEEGGRSSIKDLGPYIDHARKTVTSTTGKLRLDYGKGVLTIDAPRAQGVSGALREAGTAELKDLSVRSAMDLGHVVAVTLDGEPMARSKKILLQVMSEEKASGFRTEPAGTGLRRIAAIGQDPWLVRALDGVVRLRRADAATLTVTALDHNGYPGPAVGTAAEITLRPTTVYYLIAP